MGKTIHEEYLKIPVRILETDGEALADAARNLCRQAGGFRKALRDALTIGGQWDYAQTAARYGKKLTDQLLILQMRLGVLKSAAVDAVMPLAAVLVPVFNEAALVLIRFLRGMEDVLSVLAAGKSTMAEVGNWANGTAKRETQLAKSVTTAGKAARRSLADFDQLNRLQGASEGNRKTLIPGKNLLFPDMSPLTEKILQLMEPLRHIRFEGAQEAFKKLAEAAGNLGRVLLESLEWAWFHILTPLSTWTVEAMVPAAVNALSAALELLTQALVPVRNGICLLQESLEPVAAFIGNSIIGILQLWREKCQSLASLLCEKAPEITAAFQTMGTCFSEVWGCLQPILNGMQERFLSMFDSVWHAAELAVGTVIDLMTGLTMFLSRFFAGDLQDAWNSLCTTAGQWMQNMGAILKNGFSTAAGAVLTVFTDMGTALGEIFGWTGQDVRDSINRILEYINRMISGVVGGMNAVIRALNQIQIDIPHWVPVWGGNSYGLHLPGLDAPRIPYLAQGAVLPANRPFMAVLGDQKHGTNVEAPLAVIQEAVTATMQNHTDALLAGFEASVGIQREILEAILGIRIGDALLSDAVESYHSKMAVVKGELV